MTTGATGQWPRERDARWRSWCLVAIALIVLAILVPPFATEARRLEYVATLQFSLLALALPALVAVGAPWRVLHLARRRADAEPRPADRLADRRRRHRELPWSLLLVGCDIALVVAWHTPDAVSSTARHGWVAVIEAVSLLVFGLGLWLELVASPPLVPRSGHLRRAALAGFTMWAFWILAYMTGLSNGGFYRSFHHVAGDLSAAADQQIAAALLWFITAAAFVPVIFWNAMRWLQTDDPDSELLALIRRERRWGVPPVGGSRRPDPPR